MSKLSAFLTSGTAATSDAAASDRTMGCPGAIGAAVAIKVLLNKIKIKMNNITMVFDDANIGSSE